jgi:hypothetical protein
MVQLGGGMALHIGREKEVDERRMGDLADDRQSNGHINRSLAGMRTIGKKERLLVRGALY